MAIFRMQISSVARSSGRRATAAAAYRAGERVRDERSGDLHNFTRRRDVMHAEIFLPSQFEGLAVAWARNRERLWNTAEHAEKRYNARVAREYQVTLPAELNGAQRIALARTFAGQMANRYKVAVDLAVHEPRPGSDPRNFHAHLLTTTREVTPTGLGAKAGLDMQARERHRRELPDHRQEYVNVRELWANLANGALREANIDARIDHRSLAEQGIDREPRPVIPLMHLKMEQRGLPSAVAQRLRAEYQERVRRRQEHAPERGAQTTEVSQSQRAPSNDADSDHLPPTTDMEEIKRRAREAWLLFRSKEAAKASNQFPEPRPSSEHTATEREVRQSEAQVQQDDLSM